MKKLEELGISPAPWSVDADQMMLDSNGHYIQLNGNCFEGKEDRAVADQNMMVASPRLYEEQYHDCVALRTIVTKLDEGMEVLNLRDILAEMADRMEAALAEAAGEEVEK